MLFPALVVVGCNFTGELVALSQGLAVSIPSLLSCSCGVCNSSFTSFIGDSSFMGSASSVLMLVVGNESSNLTTGSGSGNSSGLTSSSIFTSTNSGGFSSLITVGGGSSIATGSCFGSTGVSSTFTGIWIVGRGGDGNGDGGLT